MRAEEAAEVSAEKKMKPCFGKRGMGQGKKCLEKTREINLITEGQKRRPEDTIAKEGREGRALQEPEGQAPAPAAPSGSRNAAQRKLEVRQRRRRVALLSQPN